MRPTRIERWRRYAFSQAVCNLLGQLVIIPGLSLWTHGELSWVHYAFLTWGAVCATFWAVGYRRYRMRMQLVLLDIAVNMPADTPVFYLNDLWMQDIIDYKTFRRLTQQAESATLGFPS